MTHPLPKQTDSPFSLESEDAYRRWRDAKLAGYPRQPQELVTEIADPLALSVDELQSIGTSCTKTNMAIYRCSAPVPRNSVIAIAGQLGLTRLNRNPGAGQDGVTSLQVGAGGDVADFIPYSDRRLNWHTDGYYNDAGSRINAFLLHCDSAAPSGGENRLLDHEIAYIQLRDRDPDLVAALMLEDAMVIPANVRDDTVLRTERVGPVFYVDRHQRLHMRYTHRSRSITWKEHPDVTRARAALGDILDSSPGIFRHTLAPGEGIVCNNVLHARSGFLDDATRPRHLYRLRSYDYVNVYRGH